MCGDGANDCGALKAAHTGISLSEAESSVASPFTSKNPDITCVLNIIKEGRAALVTSFGIFKYMASYSLCQFVSVMILYSIDSNLTDMEFLYIDLFIISIFAFFFGRTEAYSGKLVKQTPLNSLISLSPVLSLLLQLMLLIFFQVLSFEHVKTESWYVPFNYTSKSEKDEVGCVENYAVFTVSSFQYIILAIVFSKGPPYRQSIFSNYGFILSALAMTAFSIYMTIDPLTFLTERFELVMPETYEFRYILLAYAFANFVASIILEHVVIELLVFKKLRYKYHNVDKSKKKFLAIERDLSKDSKWPVLSSNVPSAASPLTPLPSCMAHIVIENEKLFDKNHVLHTLQNPHDTPKSTKSIVLKDRIIINNYNGDDLVDDVLDGTELVEQVSPISLKTNGDISGTSSPIFSSVRSDPFLDDIFDGSPIIFLKRSSPSSSSHSIYNNNNNNTGYETAASDNNISPVLIKGIAPRARNESLSNDDCLRGTPEKMSSFNAYGQSPSSIKNKPKGNSNLELNDFEHR